jgi:hypothetical protein
MRGPRENPLDRSLSGAQRLGAVRNLRLAVVIAGAIAATLVGSARLASRHFLFPVDGLVRAEPPVDAVTRAFVAKDGVPVHALELPAAREGAPVVVYFHGNRETVESCVPYARALRDRGLSVLLVEYRGYGRSSGAAPTEDGLYLDAEAALDALASRGIGPSRVVLWGRSLGTGVAAEMAARARGSALVLVTPFTSIPDLVTRVAPVVPARALMPDRFDTRSKAAAIRVPLLVVHGDADEVVPFAMGEEIARAVPGARMLRVPGATHNDVLSLAGEPLLRDVAALAFAAR